jgi:hypothetical protein
VSQYATGIKLDKNADSDIVYEQVERRNEWVDGWIVEQLVLCVFELNSMAENKLEEYGLLL